MCIYQNPIILFIINPTFKYLLDRYITSYMLVSGIIWCTDLSSRYALEGLSCKAILLRVDLELIDASIPGYICNNPRLILKTRPISLIIVERVG